MVTIVINKKNWIEKYDTTMTFFFNFLGSKCKGILGV